MGSRLQFAIKVMKENGEIVGHLSKELSRTVYCALLCTVN